MQPRSCRSPPRRHNLKLGGRWLYQRQTASSPGDAGLLGYFFYSGAFTGFPFADFLLVLVASQKGLGTAAAPWTQLQHRIGPLRPGRLQGHEQSDVEPRPRLGVHLAARGEGRPSVHPRSHHWATALGRTGRQQPSALRRFLRRLRTPAGLRLDPRGEVGRPRWVRHGPVHGRHGEEPPADPSTRRTSPRARGSTTPPLDPGKAADGFADVDPNVTGSGYLFRAFAKDVRPQLTQQIGNVFVESAS